MTGDGLGLAEVHLQYPRGGTRLVPPPPPSPGGPSSSTKEQQPLPHSGPEFKEMVCTMDQITDMQPLSLLVSERYCTFVTQD